MPEKTHTISIVPVLKGFPKVGIAKRCKGKKISREPLAISRRYSLDRAVFPAVWRLFSLQHPRTSYFRKKSSKILALRIEDYINEEECKHEDENGKGKESMVLHWIQPLCKRREVAFLLAYWDIFSAPISHDSFLPVYGGQGNTHVIRGMCIYVRLIYVCRTTQRIHEYARVLDSYE